MNRFPMTAVAFALLAAGCGRKEAVTTSAPVPVGEVRIIQSGMIEDSFLAIGTVKAETMATLAAKLAGNVTSVRVHEGDRVRQGEILLTIDDRDLAAQQSKARAEAAGAESSSGVARAARDSAAASARLATSTYERYRALRARNSVSPQEFDEVEGRYRMAIAEGERAAQAYEQSRSQRQVAAADIAAASATLSWSRIAAPFDGVITARWIDPGTQATPGMPLLAIESTQRYRVDASLDEQHASSVSLGESVAISLRDGSAIAGGTVRHIAPAPDPITRSYLLQISLPPGQKVTSGSSVTVRFPVGQRNAIAIPRTALVDRGELHEVWTVEPGDVLRMRYVTPGVVSGDQVEILTGLSAGDRIVVDAHRPLTDGARVATLGARNGS